MSKNDDYEDGYQAGRNGFLRGSSNSEYVQGYWEGKQEYDYWNDKNLYPSLRYDGEKHTEGAYDPLADDTSTFLGMVGGSIALVIVGWCLVGLILFLFWVGGQSGSWWFPWIWRIAFWGGVGFIVMMSIAGIAATAIEYHEAKNPPAEPADDPNLLRNQTNDHDLWKKKYPLGDIETVKEAEVANDKDK